MSPSPHASRHVEEATLVALLNGELDAEAAEGIEHHLRVCRKCAQQVEQWSALFGDLDRVIPTHVRPSPEEAQAEPSANPTVLVPAGHTGETGARRPLSAGQWPWLAGVALALTAGLLLMVGFWRRPAPVAGPLRTPALVEAGMGPDTASARATALAAAPNPSITPPVAAAATPPPARAASPAPTVQPRPSATAPRLPEREPAAAPVGPEPLAAFRPATLAEAARELSGPARQLRGVQLVSVEIGPGDSVPGATAGRPLIRLRYRDADRSPLILDQQRLAADEPGQPRLPGDTLVSTSGDGVTVLMWRDHQRWFSLASPATPARLFLVLPSP